MAKRVKPVLNIPAVTTLEEADATLAQIAARKRELALLELGLKEDVDTLKLKCAETSEPIKQDIEVLEQALIRFGESKKSELFVKKALSGAHVRHYRLSGKFRRQDHAENDMGTGARPYPRRGDARVHQDKAGSG